MSRQAISPQQTANAGLTDAVLMNMQAAASAIRGADACLGAVAGPRGATPMFASDCCGSSREKLPRR